MSQSEDLKKTLFNDSRSKNKSYRVYVLCYYFRRTLHDRLLLKAEIINVKLNDREEVRFSCRDKKK